MNSSLADILSLPEHPEKNKICKLIKEFETWSGIIVMLHLFNENKEVMSQQALPLLGHTPGKWDMHFISSITHPDDIFVINEKMSSYLIESLQPVYDREAPYIMKLFGRLRHVNGRYSPMEFSGVILRFHENGSFDLGLGVFQDITHKYKSDATRRESEQYTRRIEQKLSEIKTLYHRIYPAPRSITTERKNKGNVSELYLFDSNNIDVKISQAAATQKMMSKSPLLDLGVRELDLTSLKTAENKFITRILEVIDMNLTRTDLTVDTLVDHLYVSRTNLFRKLRATLGLTPSELIKVVRLNKAALLLKQQHTVHDVAYRVGFEDPSYFSKCFRQQFDRTPSEFRKNQEQ
jgi:AraC-like DNA-binding protein